jgi:quinol monooxygenase YgiN
MSVTRINHFEAKSGMASDLREFLISIIPLIKHSSGCESCQFLQDQENFEKFVVIEVWVSRDAHQASVKNIPPEKIGAVMPLLATQPTGFYFSLDA